MPQREIELYELQSGHAVLLPLRLFIYFTLAFETNENSLTGHLLCQQL